MKLTKSADGTIITSKNDNGEYMIYEGEQFDVSCTADGNPLPKIVVKKTEDGNEMILVVSS